MTKLHFSRREALQTSILASAMPLLSGCSSLFPPGYRFRMTVEAETPHGPITGSSIYQIKGRTYFVWESKQRFDVLGEALFLDHPTGAVFIPLDGNVNAGRLGLSFAHQVLAASRGYTASVPESERRHGDLFEQISDIDSFWRTTSAVLERYPGQDGYEQSLTSGKETWGDLPMVRFKDIKDPSSVEWIDADTLGIRRIIVSTTSEKITESIASTLPWLGLPWNGDPVDRWTDG